MNDADKIKLKKLIESAYAFFDKPLTAPVAQIWLQQMAPYDISDIENAFRAFHATMKRPPLPADIMEYMPDPLGHPLPEEAWNAIPKSESEGGFFTSQMMAAYGAALSSIERGDMIAARVAFLETYKRFLNDAKTKSIQAEFFYSAPTGLTRDQVLMDKERNIITAATKKWITPKKAMTLLERICEEQGRESTPYRNQLEAMTAGLPLTATTSQAVTKISGPVLESLRLISDQVSINQADSSKEKNKSE